MKDPLCPYCRQAKASEHEDTLCLSKWVFNEPGFKEHCHGFWATEWKHAGPLLEEMIPDINGVVLMSGLKVPQYAILFYNEVGSEVRAKTFTLCICRSYLIWKANKETAK